MKTIRYITAALLAGVFFVSCYKDQSTMAGEEIPEIAIRVDGAEADTLTVAYGETLSLRAVIRQQGYKSGDFSFSWEFDIQAGSSDGRYEICDTEQLEYLVSNLPSSVPYYLSLTVTNTKLDYRQMLYWPVYVTNPYGEGLLVAHTRDGGKTSDLSLVSDTPVTYGYSKDKPTVRRDIYSYNNDGKTIPGSVTSMLVRHATDMNAANVASYNDEMIMVGTADHIYNLNPVTFNIKESDAELFTKSYDGYGVKMLFNCGAYSSHALIGDGTMYVCSDIMDRQYSKMSYPNEVSAVFDKTSVAFARANQGSFAGFDKVDHKFHFARGWNAYSATFDAVDDFALPFDLKTATCIAAGGVRNDDLMFIMKSGEGKYYAVILVNGNTVGGTAYELDLPEIDKAVTFAMCDNAYVFYYATPDKIYSTIITGSTAVTKALSWKPDSTGEKITLLQQYDQAWLGIHNYWTYEMTLPTHRLQIIIATYNASKKEGKIYLRPFNVSTGAFTTKVNGVYDGFGEITAITTTMR